ncbi:malto-oligosyltrehalose trehalohydrolase [Brevibacterium sp. NPDC049920]|uniref:malto-oligosyltrehalose trehalohydrolase n=1 Tax=Brevibacterium sp. NPDC049920 TaxID=3155279 RepID=UPI0033EA87F4
MTRYPGIDATFHFPDYPSIARGFVTGPEAGPDPDAGSGTGINPVTGSDPVFRVWAPAAGTVRLAWRLADAPYGTDFARTQYREAPVESEELNALGFHTEAMEATPAGWWAVTAPSDALTAVLRDLADHAAGAPGGTEAPVIEYGYLLDEDPTLRPDPRSRRQPYGPHGPSATVPVLGQPGSASAAGSSPNGGWADRADGEPAPTSASDDPAANRASDGGWAGRAWDSSPVYELHIGTFTSAGTFDAAIEKLDHLVRLGIGWVELLPVNTFAGLHNWGYDGVGWFAVQESCGGPEGYRRFVEAAHARGIGVIQDVVYNHLGPSGSYLGMFGPYLHAAAANPWGDSINLDGPGSDEVRALILDDLAMFAADYGVDAFRLDAVHALLDSRALPILEDMTIHMEELARTLGRAHPIHIIAESDLNAPRLITARADGGDGLTGQWSDDFHHAVHVALTGETEGYYADFADPEALPKVLRSGFFHDGTLSTFRGRAHGRPIDGDRVSPGQLIVCIQNHDQVGNRAAGERLSHLVGTDALAVGAVLLMLAPNTPMLFMGEEWAASTPWQFFTDHREDWLGEAVSNGRKSEFARMGWDESAVPDPQDPETFTRSVLDWTEFGEGGSGDDSAEEAGAGVPGSEAAGAGAADAGFATSGLGTGSALGAGLGTGSAHGTGTAARRAIFELYCALGALRAERPEFRELAFADITVDASAGGGSAGDRWVAMTIGGLHVVANLGTEAAAVELPGGAASILLDTAGFLAERGAGSGEDSHASRDAGGATDADGELFASIEAGTVRVPPRSAVVLTTAS